MIDTEYLHLLMWKPETDKLLQEAIKDGTPVKSEEYGYFPTSEEYISHMKYLQEEAIYKKRSEEIEQKKERNKESDRKKYGDKYFFISELSSGMMENKLCGFRYEAYKLSTGDEAYIADTILTIFESLSCFKSHTSESFYYWTNSKWLRGDDTELQFMIREAGRKVGLGNIYLLNSIKKITAMVLSQTSGMLPLKYNPNNRYLGFSNGILDLETKELLEIKSDLCPRFTINVEYNPESISLDFDKVLSDVLSGSQILVLQEGIGKCLMPPEELEKLVMLTGNGRNGKSTIIAAIEAALGKENVSFVKLCDMVDSKGLGIADSEGKLLNISNEGNKVRLGDEERLKSLASGEPLICKRLYKQPYITTDYPQSICVANVMPATSDVSEGFRRRFLIIDFNKDIPKNSIDIKLKERLRSKENREGVISWILEGYWRLKENGKFSDSPEVEAAEHRYKTESDSVASFMYDKNFSPSDIEKTEADSLFRDFITWSKEENLRYELTKKGFFKRLRQLGYKVESSNSKMWVYAINPENIPEELLPF